MVGFMRTFNVIGCDTDSILFCKEDQNEFSEEECVSLLKDLNSHFPEGISWEDDGTFETVIVFKAKNYVLKKKGQKPKYKGSALKATLKEPRLKDFIKELIKEIGLEREEYLKVYNTYVKEIQDIKSIDGWVTKKTITEAVEKSERTNESKVRDILVGTDYRSGDKIYTYFKPDKSLGLKENFDGSYCKDTLLKKLYKTAEIFETVIDTEQFLDYSLKRNKKALNELLTKGEE